MQAIDSHTLVDTFKYLDTILELISALGGVKVINKTWTKANDKVWQIFLSNLFTWILLMVVSR